VVNAFTPDRIAIRDFQSGRLLTQFRRLHRLTSALAISPDDPLLAAGDFFGEIAILDIDSGRMVRKWRAHDFIVLKAAYTRDGRSLLSSGADGTVRSWDLATGQALRIFQHPTNSHVLFDLSPSGHQLVTGSEKILRVWDLETGQCERELHGHSEWIVFASFTPDGKRIVSTAVDHTVRTWDVRSGRLLTSWRLHGDGYVFAISADGKRVALRVSQGVGAGMDAPTLELWDVESGHQLLSYRGAMERASVIGFSPDGHRLVCDWRSSDLRAWEAFPWRNAAYPDSGGRSLRDRDRVRITLSPMKNPG
jgi:WD40 repeat protein